MGEKNVSCLLFACRSTLQHIFPNCTCLIPDACQAGSPSMHRLIILISFQCGGLKDISSSQTEAGLSCHTLSNSVRTLYTQLLTCMPIHHTTLTFRRPAHEEVQAAGFIRKTSANRETPNWEAGEESRMTFWSKFMTPPLFVSKLLWEDRPLPPELISRKSGDSVGRGKWQLPPGWQMKGSNLPSSKRIQLCSVESPSIRCESPYSSIAPPSMLLMLGALREPFGSLDVAYESNAGKRALKMDGPTDVAARANAKDSEAAAFPLADLEAAAAEVTPSVEMSMTLTTANTSEALDRTSSDSFTMVGGRSALSRMSRFSGSGHGETCNMFNNQQSDESDMTQLLSCSQWIGDSPQSAAQIVELSSLYSTNLTRPERGDTNNPTESALCDEAEPESLAFKGEESGQEHLSCKLKGAEAATPSILSLMTSLPSSSWQDVHSQLGFEHQQLYQFDDCPAGRLRRSLPPIVPSRARSVSLRIPARTSQPYHYGVDITASHTTICVSEPEQPGEHSLHSLHSQRDHSTCSGHSLRQSPSQSPFHKWKLDSQVEVLEAELRCVPSVVVAAGGSVTVGALLRSKWQLIDQRTTMDGADEHGRTQTSNQSMRDREEEHLGVLLFRGLRVRTGVHSGMQLHAEGRVNTVSGRMQYTGG